MKIVRARAPVRLSFGGGGTDFSPYMEKHGGIVLSTTIDRYAYCTVSESKNFHFESSFAGAAVKSSRASLPISVSHFTEAPAGSGLGGSSSLMIAIIKAVTVFYGETLTPHQIAELAYKVERKDLGIQGGYQDQFAAAYGGWNLMEFSKNIGVERVNVSEDVLRELLASLILVDLGISRVSSHIIIRQIKSYEKPEIIQVLDVIKTTTRDMHRALIDGNLEKLGLLLSQEWAQKKKLDRKISNSLIDRFHAGMLKHGAIGGKLCGAGSGGHMLFLSDLSKRKDLLDYVAACNFKHVPFKFDSQGVVAWQLKDGEVLT